MGAGIGYYHVPLDDGPSTDPTTGSLFLDAVRVGETASYRCYWYDTLVVEKYGIGYGPGPAPPYWGGEVGNNGFATQPPLDPDGVDAPSNILAWVLAGESGGLAAWAPSGGSAEILLMNGTANRDGTPASLGALNLLGIGSAAPSALTPSGYALASDDAAPAVLSTTDAGQTYSSSLPFFALQSGYCRVSVSGMVQGGIHQATAAKYVLYHLLRPDGTPYLDTYVNASGQVTRTKRPSVAVAVRRYVPVAVDGTVGPDAGASRDLSGQPVMGAYYSPYRHTPPGGYYQNYINAVPPVGSALAPNGTDYPNPGAGRSAVHRFVVGFTWSPSLDSSTPGYTRLKIDIEPKAGGLGESTAYPPRTDSYGFPAGYDNYLNAGFNFSATPVSWSPFTADNIKTLTIFPFPQFKEALNLGYQFFALDLTDKCLLLQTPPATGFRDTQNFTDYSGEAMAVINQSSDSGYGSDLRTDGGPNTTLFTGNPNKPLGPYTGRFAINDNNLVYFPQTVTVRLRPTTRQDVVRFTASEDGFIGHQEYPSLRPIWLWGASADITVPLTPVGGRAGGGGAPPVPPPPPSALSLALDAFRRPLAVTRGGAGLYGLASADAGHGFTSTPLDAAGADASLLVDEGRNRFAVVYARPSGPNAVAPGLYAATGELSDGYVLDAGSPAPIAGLSGQYPVAAPHPTDRDCALMVYSDVAANNSLKTACSFDRGATWQAVATVLAGLDLSGTGRPALAWLGEMAFLAYASGSSLLACASPDRGATWGPAVAVATSGPYTGLSLLGWQGTLYLLYFTNPATGSPVAALSISRDLGATWDAAPGALPAGLAAPSAVGVLPQTGRLRLGVTHSSPDDALTWAVD